MKIYIIVTAVICCLMLMLPLAFTGIYPNGTDNKNTVTTNVTATQDSILF